MDFSERFLCQKNIQDDPIQEIFRDSAGLYFGTTWKPNQLIPNSHFLAIERLNEIMLRLRDSLGNDFQSLEWSEVQNITWKGKPLFTILSPAWTARPNEPSFSAKTTTPFPANQGYI